MEIVVESEQEEGVNNTVDSVSDLELTSTSSHEDLPIASVSSVSADVSAGSSISGGGSGDISAPASEARRVALNPPTVSGGDVTIPATRLKCVGRNNRGVTWGFTSVIGRRKEMEDAVRVSPGFLSRTCDHVGGCTAPGSRTSGEVSPVHFFGVYDGHGGSQVALFCEQRMHEIVAEEWDRETVNVEDWRRRWEDVFIKSFERADNELIIEAPAPEMVGSTAVVVILSGCQIIASNCGDSRAILCRGTDTVALTVDHKPDREDELLRIEGQGGKVINWNGARVFGVLAMSRAIGDRYMRPWVIPVPDITFTTRSDEDECLILASDGLWDVMSNDEVGDVACHLLRRRRRSMTDETPAAQAVADSLTEIALRKSSSDNISIIVVDLKAKRTRRPRP